MKKKVVGLAAAVFILISCIPIFGSVLAAESGECGENLTWTFDNNTLTISGSGTMNNYQASEYVPWYSFKNDIHSVVIEEGIISIEKNAFYGYSNLSSVKFPESLIVIGENAFYGCNKLTAITFPKKLQAVSANAFAGCSNISQLYVSDLTSYLNIRFQSFTSNPMYYAKQLYADNTLVTSADIPDGIKKIPDCAFANCTLTSATIPDSVTEIGNYAFYKCGGLTSIEIPDSVTEIGNYAFSKCSGLTNITMPGGVTKIGSHAFAECNKIESLVIPDSVTDIGNSAFWQCYNMTEITIGSNVANVGESAFYGCNRLDKLYISDIASYLNIDFKNKNSTPMSYADKLYLNNKRVTSLDIPEGVTKICDYALSCDSIKSVKLPESLQSIGEGAFKGNGQLSSVSIPKNVTSIGVDAFRNCNNLTEITLPFVGTSPSENKTVNSVFGSIFGYSETKRTETTEQIYADGASAFYYIPSTLQKVTLTNAEQIPYGAFSNCVGLTEITIPENTASIGDNSFKGCNGLTAVNYNAIDCKNENSGSVFSACPSLKTVNLGKNVNAIPRAMFMSCKGLETLKFDNVTSIGTVAFAECTGLTNISLPKTVMEIEQAAFRNCSNLTTVRYSGNEKEWEDIFIASGNECLTNSNIQYNASSVSPSPSPSASPSPSPSVSPSPSPSASPSPSPAQILTVNKSETEDTYNFELITDKAYENYDVFAAVYSSDGVLLSLNTIPLSVTENIYISVKKTEKDAYAKIFVFSKDLQPLTGTANEFSLK